MVLEKIIIHFWDLCRRCLSKAGEQENFQIASTNRLFICFVVWKDFVDTLMFQDLWYSICNELMCNLNNFGLQYASLRYE
jgi:hypothetical protein